MIDVPALIQRQNVGEKVFEILKGWIFAGDLKPGERIIEVSMARRLNVSRAPLREAIQLLAQRGFVTINPYRGAFVTQLSDQDIREIFDIREPLEILAAKHVRKRMNPEMAAHLEGALDKMHQAVAARDVIRFAETDFEFHRTFWKFSGNRHLMKILVDLTIRFFGFEQIRDAADTREFRFDAVYADHRRLVDLLTGGTDEEIAREVREQSNKFLAYVILRFKKPDNRKG